MKVIMVTDLSIWSMGSGKGGEAFARTVMKYRDMGDEVYLISDIEENLGSSLVDHSHNRVIRSSIFKQLISIRKAGFLFRIIDHYIATKRFERAIGHLVDTEEKEPVVLYAYEIFGVEACKRAARKYGLPFVTRFQGTQMSLYSYNLCNRLLRYPHFQALGTRSDLVIMTNDGTRGDQVLDELNNTSDRLFIMNGLELMEREVYQDIQSLDIGGIRKSVGVSDKDIMFITVSRLTGWKRVDRAISGFADFVKKGGHGKLVIVGDGDKRGELEELSVKLGVGESTVFLGSIKHYDVYKYIRSADVFMSLYDLSNVGNPLLEAMALGKAIITYDVGDTSKIINGDNGILIAADKLNELSDIMLELAHDSVMRQKLGDNAQKYALDNFVTWEERMDEEYNSVVSLVINDPGNQR